MNELVQVSPIKIGDTFSRLQSHLREQLEAEFQPNALSHLERPSETQESNCEKKETQLMAIRQLPHRTQQERKMLNMERRKAVFCLTREHDLSP